MERSPSAARAGALTGTVQVVAATLFYAAVAPAAKLVALDAAAITGWRAVFGAASLALVLAWRENALRVARADFGSIALMGLLMAGNWYFFVLSAKVATVAIAVVCLFSYPLLTAVFEPWFFGERRRATELAGGVLVVLGCVLLVERPSLGDATLRGALFGVTSAVCLSLRNLLNRRAVRSYASSTLTFYQFAVAAIAFLPAIARPSGWPARGDLPLLLLIGCVLTTASHVLFTESLRHLSATRASLLLSLQPLFATLLAIALLGEVPGPRTLAGGALIVAAALLPLAGRRVEKA
jgi:drug/metabolite transporter (DMT)-like permease